MWTWPSACAVILGMATTMGWSWANAGEPTVGKASPAFELGDQAGKTHRLSDYHGRWLVLYFYPKDDTPGCTKEACRFRDDHSALRALGAEVLGVSLDTRDSHVRFAEKYKLPFPLLTDPDGATARAYGALWSLGPIKFTRRHSFLIDPDGKIAEIYRKVDPETHSEQIQRDLANLQKRSVPR
jgi:thioredoxin-dependent peroxiredoxin